jgi:predicted nuclease of predicted toxin-antitoxin system
MKILIDECLPKKLKREFPDHDVSTVEDMGWKGKKNGELLSLIEQEFEVFVTIDSNMSNQQKLSKYKIAYVFLSAKTNRLEDVKPFIPEVLEKLDELKTGDILKVGND